MKKVFNGVVAAIMPLGLCLAAPTTSGSYSYVGQRKQDYLTQKYPVRSVYNLPNSLPSSSSPQLAIIKPLSNAELWQKNDTFSEAILEISSLKRPAFISNHLVEVDELYIAKQTAIKTLIVIDEGVSDKHLFYQELKPGIDIVEISSSNNGLTQLKKLLSGYQNLQALHLVSHGEDGVIQLGNSQVTEQLLTREMTTLSALDNALVDGADLHIYGCNVAKTAKGEQLLELIANQAHVDVAASDNTTGSGQSMSDWRLEIVKGDIESKQLFDNNSMRDFSDVLAVNDGVGATIITNGFPQSGAYTTTRAYEPTSGFNLTLASFNSSSAAAAMYCGFGYCTVDPGGDSSPAVLADELRVYFSGGQTFNLTSIKLYTPAGNNTYVITPNVGVASNTASIDTLSSSFADVNLSLTGITSISIKRSDGGDINGLSIDDLVINSAAAPNNTPSISIDNSTLAYTEGDTATQIDSAGTVSDADGDSDWNGGSLSAQVTANSEAGDKISIDDTDGDGTAITISGTNILSNGTDIGDLSTSGGTVTGGMALTITFDSDATNTNVQEVLQSIRYRTTSDSPGTSNRTVTLMATDSNAASSNDTRTISMAALDNDGSLTSAGGVTEPIDIDTTLDAVGEAVDVFDFTLSDGGSTDSEPMAVSQIVLNVSGTASDSVRDQITWRLNGNDASNVTGVYNAGANTITFSALSISIANGGSEVYTVNAYYNDNTGITEGQTIILSVDGDTDLTVASSIGTGMGSTSAVNNSTGSVIDIIATNLVFTTQPSGSVSGVVITTQPVIVARDAFGNTDIDFTEIVTLTEASAGFLNNNLATAVSGIATFSGLNYTATADQQAFTLTADDEGGVGSNLALVNANSVTSDVVATQLIFDTQPVPLLVNSASATSFSTVPVVSAVDANGLRDTGYTSNIVFTEASGAGTAALSATGDTDGDGATVTLAASAGIATFTGMQINYSPIGAASETFNLRASSGGLTIVDSSQLMAAYPTPTISLATYDALTKMLVVTGTNFVANAGGSDVDVSDLTLSGQGGGSRSIITSSDVEIDNANQFTVTLSGSDIAAIDALLNTNGTQSIDAVTYNLAAADDFITFLTDGDTSDLTGNSITASNIVDSDGNLTAASGVNEPIGLDTTVDTLGEAVNVFDFTLTDGGTADGSAMTVSQVVVNVSGTASDIERNQVTWRLNGNDVSNVTGVYNATVDTITFSGLSISIADGTNEVYTVNAYYNDNTGITEDNIFVLSLDGDTDLTLGSGTQMGATSALTNGAGGTFDVTATALVVTTQPAGSVSGVALTTQPVITAQDAFGNTDVNFNEIIALTEASAGSISSDTATASSGIATFSGLTYTATADQQSFTLTANDQDGVGSDLSIIDTHAVTSDVVATKLVFTTQPGPLSVKSATLTSVSPVPVVSAQDASGLVDTGYSTNITLAEVNGAGSATMSATGDADGSGATVTINPSAGVATFTSMQLTYTASGGADENFNLQATSGGLSTAISSQFTSGTFDSDASVTAASGVIEPVAIASFADTSGEAVELLDFTVNDGGTSDNKATVVSEIKIHVSGTASASKFTYLLSGSDANNVTGSLSTGVVTFSGLSISVADSQSEVYTVSAYYNDNSNLTEGHTLILSTDGDSDFTLATGYTEMAATSPINNSTGSTVDIIATELRFTTQPAGSVSGVALTTQPVVKGTDAFGNVDPSFTETITLTEASAGSINSNTKAAVSGVATFASLSYTATADQQSFTLTADDQAGVGSDFATIDANAITADVVATTLVFDSYLTPDIISSEQNSTDDSFAINNNEYLQPIVILAQDNNGLLDTGYSGDVTIAQGITNLGSALTMSTLNDIDGDAETITLTASNGQVSFTELNIAYKAASASDLLRLDISDNVASTSNTTGSNIAVNIAPYIKEQTDSFGPIDIDEDVKTALDTLDIQAYDADNNALVLTVNVDKGLLFAVDGDSVQNGVTIADSNDSAGSQAITLSGTATDINNFLDTARFEYQTALNDTTSPTLTIVANDGVLNGANTLTETFTVTAINDAPLISGTPVTTVAEDSAYSFIPTVTDVDSGDSQSFTIANKPNWMSFDANTGELSGTPGDNDVGLFSDIVITVTDSENATASLTAFDLEVTNVNDAPTISGTPSSAIAEDSLYSFTPSAIDVDSGDILTFSITNKPNWMSFNTSTGLLSGVPSNDDVGTSTNIIISVMDSAGLNTSLNAFAITVTNVNDAPVISGTPTTQVNEDSAYSFIPSASDVDAGSSLSFSITNKPTWATFNSVTGALAGTPNNTDVGTTTGVVITVSDGLLSSSLATFSITVANVNDAPMISGTPTTQINEDSAYSFIPSASDVDAGSSLSFSITNQPSWTIFSAVTGELTGTPGNADVGTTSGVVISVSDGALSSSLAAFSITVNNVNDAPVISGTPATQVNEDSAYSFIPSASDVDVGSTLGFSITNQPAWTTFSTVTGALTGTPSNADIGTTTGVVITVSDGLLNSSLAAFSITVSNINDAPVISGMPDSQVNEDSSYSFTPTVTDVDEGDVHSFSISGHPDWMLFDEETGSVSGTPVQDDVDVTSDITITVNDNSGAENATDSLNFSVVVNNINQEPTAVADRFELTLNDTNTYVLDVLKNDIDIDGDTLIITGATTSIGSVTHDRERLTVTTQAGFVGQMKLLYTITDGSDVFIDGTVDLLISGELGASVPVITVPEDVDVNATGLYTKVDLGVATAVNSDGKPVAISLVNGNTLFKPGSHIAYWQATDPTTGLTSVASQQVIVNPLISLDKNQIVVEGKTALVNVILNGEAPNYPVTVTLNITGSADDSDYIVASNEVIIASGKQAQLMVDIIQDNLSEGDETLTLSINDGNIGSKSNHVITIVERNIAPAISLVSSQNNESRQVVTPTHGLVTVQAAVSDANDDNVSSVWSYDSALNINQLDDNTLELDPSELSVGVYRVGITSTDDGMGNLATTKSLYLAVVASLAELTDIDTDGDRIPDNEEGYGDADQDGIPDFQDAIAECNVMPEQASIQDAFLVEGEPGICLRKGNTLAAGETGGLQLTNNDLENSIGTDNEAVFVGGIFDYIVTGLPEAGQTYQIVLPQLQPIPTGAVYRKYSESAGWGLFVEDANNQLHSTAGTQGYCPPPASALWTSGLTAGHWCVQLTLEDGGPNDNDGISNGTIVDPGGVSVLLTDNALPVAQADSIRVKRNQATVIDVLANDTDADQDTLTLGVVSANFGVVSITADNKLAYQSATNFVGQDTVAYSLSDGNGGTASSTVDITVYVNDAPIALDDTASTDDRTAIVINVLANDTDADGDSLVVVSATVDNGSVVINEDSTLTYTAASGFDGTALITYIVDDGQGDQASAQVSVTVKAYQSVTVKNESKGGSMGLMIIVLAGVVLYRSRRKRSRVNKHIMQGAAALAVATSMNAAAAEPQWFLTGSIGKSQVSESINTPSDIGITSRNIDKSDASYSVGGGVKYDAFAFTVSYEQLGEASASFSGDTLNASSFHQALAESAPKLVDGISLQGQYTFWQNDVMHASVGLGVLAWELDYTSKLNDSVINMDEDDIDLFYNLALGYTLTEQIDVSLKVSRYNLSVNDVNNIALGVTYHF